MTEEVDKGRKPRADSLRNREQLLAAAKQAFTADGAEVALEEIARRAGVGIGTLYRHFPTRAALLAEVYRRDVDQLAGSAESLLAQRPPLEALRAWLHLLIDYMATKRVVAPALRASGSEGAELYATSGAAITGALDRLVAAGLQGGAVRPGLTTEDLFRMLMGLSHGYDAPDWEPSARRLIDVVVAGVRA